MGTSIKIFEYYSYKKFLADWIKIVGGRGSLTRIAKAAGCHRTYLSQVLNSKVDLTLDHAASLIHFFNFGTIEADYFLTCVMYDRATQSTAKEYFLKKLERVGKQQTTVTARLSSSKEEAKNDDINTDIYYSSSIFALIHIATSCQNTQTAAQISKYFKIPIESVMTTLEHLVKNGLVTRSGARFIHSGKILHLDRSSNFTRINHLNWRLKACEDSQNENSVHYTNIFSVSKQDWRELKLRLIDFIEEQNKKIHASGTDEVVVFCCDLFSPSTA